jgi:hypothetical protein
MPIIQTMSTPFAIGTEVQLGTNGSILFVDSSGNVGQDNANLRFDNTGKILTIISGVQVDSSGIYPTVNNTKNLGLFHAKFANLWATNISGANLQSVTANTPSTASNNTAVATTAFVQSNLGSYLPMTSGTILATLASPAFVGTPTGPTADIGTNNTQLATTAFTVAYIAASGSAGGDVFLANANIFTNTNTFNDLRFGANNTYNIGTTTVRPSGLFLGASGINSIGPIISSGTISAASFPNATLTGIAVSPTVSGADSSTLIATTDFVKSAISGSRTGSVGFGFPSGTFTSGAQSLPLLVTTGRTIRGITLLGEGSGSCSIDIWKVGYANYPLGSANTIFSGSNRATIVSGIKSRDSTLSGLISPVINRFDTLKASVTSVTGLTGLTIILDTFNE